MPMASLVVEQQTKTEDCDSALSTLQVHAF